MRSSSQSQTKCVSNHVLNHSQAAAHAGFTIDAFIGWLRRGLLPAANATTGGWTATALDEAIDRLQLVGIQIDPKRKLAKQIPNIQRQPRTNTVGQKKHHHYLRGVPGALPGNPGEPAFMAALIKKHRQLAAQRYGAQASNGTSGWAANQSSSPTQTKVQAAPARAANQCAAVTANQRLAAAQPRPALVPNIPKSETRSQTDRRRQPSTAATLEALLAPSPPITSSTRIFLTPEEVSERWRGRIAVETMSNWRSAGVGPPATRIGRTILYRLDLLEQWEHHQTNIHSPLKDPARRSATVRNS